MSPQVGSARTLIEPLREPKSWDSDRVSTPARSTFHSCVPKVGCLIVTVCAPGITVAVDWLLLASTSLPSTMKLEANGVTLTRIVAAPLLDGAVAGCRLVAGAAAEGAAGAALASESFAVSNEPRSTEFRSAGGW